MRKWILSIIFLSFTFVLTACLGPAEKCAHEYEITAETLSTCDKRGERIETCKLCGATNQVTLSLLDHDYGETIVEPTCTETGYTLLKCKVCGDENRINITNKIPHDFNKIAEEASTCVIAGYYIEKCAVCGLEISEELELIEHNFEEDIIKPTCTEQGYTMHKCQTCESTKITDYVAMLEHDYTDWQTIVSATDTTDGKRERECNLCGHKETEIISSISYIDLSVIKEAFDRNKTYECDTEADLILAFSRALFNRVSELKCQLNFSFDDFNALLNRVSQAVDPIYGYQVGASLKGNDLTLNMTYTDLASTSTANKVYSQHQSANYQPISSSRDVDFADFNINNSIYSYQVSNTEQLVYVLERGVKPILENGSAAEQIYHIMEEVLIEIIDDKMSNFEKVKAIHDYIVMNVTYDNELLNLFYEDPSNLKKYNGFYLEGVFLDGKAVCEGISKAVAALCNMEGIPCVVVEGYQTQNPNGAGHAWNKVYLNGDWYILDATSDGTIMNDSFEILSYEYFLISEAKYQATYTGTTFTNIECNMTMDIYHDITFQYNELTYDFLIDSEEELAIIVDYFFDNYNENSSIEFKLNYQVKNLGSAIQKAMMANGIAGEFSYVDNGTSVLIIK